MRRSAPQPGLRLAFTLMEVMLATSLLAVVSVMIYRSLSAATRFYEHADRKMEILGAQRIDRMLLERQLAEARPWPEPYTPKDREEARRWFFQLESGRVEFLTTVSLSHAPDGRIRLVTWEPAMDDEGGLMVTERLLEGRLKPQDAPEDPELAKRLPYRLAPAETLRLGEGRKDMQAQRPLLDARSGEWTWTDNAEGKTQKFLPDAVRLAGNQAGEPFIWSFPLSNRKAGWPSYQPEEEITRKKDPNDPYSSQPDALEIQLQQAWENKGKRNFEMGQHGRATTPRR